MNERSLKRDKQRILHITNWYPNVLASGERPFILRHVKALEPYWEGHVWHIEVRYAEQWRIVTRSLYADRTLILTCPMKRWFIIEWLSTILFIWMWITREKKWIPDIVNVHIAYPLMTRTKLLMRLIRRPFVFTEHWSGYHFSFNSTSKGLDRIRRIFQHRIPVIVVSQALRRDIIEFTGVKHLEFHIVDNVAETRFFFRDGTPPMEGSFFTIAGWRFPKRPDVLLEAIALLRDRGKKIILRIAGDGPMLPQMLDQIKNLKLQDNIQMLGQLMPKEVACEMNRAHSLLHCSDYETYSAVCAEALCCGTPVIASDVGGIREYFYPDAGSLIPSNDAVSWADAIDHAWNRSLLIERDRISRYMTRRASTEAVGSAYSRILENLLHAQTKPLPNKTIRSAQ